MPFLKHNDPSAHVADGHNASHKCSWVRLSNAELNRQLRVCTEAFAEWTGDEPNMGFRYRDMAAWTLEFSRIAPNVDRYGWLEQYAGMSDDPGGLEAPFVLAFEHVPKKAYPNEAVFVTALVAGAGKADRSKLEAAALSSDGLYPSDADRSSDDKDKALTWGMLRGTGAGGRAAAFLERSVTERDKAGNKPVLVALREAAVERGRVADDEDDVVVCAYATAHELAERVIAPPAFYVYHADATARRIDALMRVRDAPDQFDGSSRFCQAHTPGIMAVCAPVVADVMDGCADVRALNSRLLELASVFPKDQAPTKPVDLFTVHGMRVIGRLTAAYAVWAADAKNTIASVDTRVDSFINRIRLNGAVGCEPGGGTGGGAGATAGGGEAAGGVGGTTLRASGEAWRAALIRVRETGVNPSILNDLLRLVAKSNHDPLDMIDIALTGKTKACPERESTALSRMLGIGKINAAALDARLAPLYEYQNTRVLVLLVSSCGVSTVFPRLWTRSDMWRTVVGSCFSFLVQCFGLTFRDGFKPPRRLADVLGTRSSSTGRLFYGSGSEWAASCSFGLGCGWRQLWCLPSANCVGAFGDRHRFDEVEDVIPKCHLVLQAAVHCAGGQASRAGCGYQELARAPGRCHHCQVQRVSQRIPAREHSALLHCLSVARLHGQVDGERHGDCECGVCSR